MHILHSIQRTVWLLMTAEQPMQPGGLAGAGMRPSTSSRASPIERRVPSVPRGPAKFAPTGRPPLDRPRGRVSTVWAAFASSPVRKVFPHAMRSPRGPMQLGSDRSMGLQRHGPCQQGFIIVIMSWKGQNLAFELSDQGSSNDEA